MKKILVLSLILMNLSTILFAQDKNRISGMASIAKKIKQGEPVPVWQTSLKELEIDELLVVPNGGVLVGLTSIYWDEWLWGSYCPSYGPYVMYDENTGQEKWSYSREKSYNNSYQVLAYAPVVLIRYDQEKKTKFIALDPQTGKTAWSFSASNTNRVCLDLIENTLFIAEQQKPNLKLTAINLTNGNQLWQSLEERFSSESQLPQLNSNGKQLFIMGKSLAAYTVESGKPAWFIDGIGTNAEQSFSAMLPDGDLIVTSPNGQLSYINPLGKIVWQTKLEHQPGILLTDKNQLYLQTTESGKQDRVYCYSLTDGHLLWGKELNGNLTSHFMVDEGKLAYTLRNRDSEHLLEIVDAQNGKLIRNQALPLQSELSLSDRLLANSGQIVVICEKAVGAFRLTDGTKLWFYNVKDPEGIYANLVEAWGKPFQAYIADNIKDNKNMKFDLGNVFQNYSSHSLTALANNNQTEVLRRTNPIISADSKASHMDRQLAITEQKTAIQFSMTSMEFQKSMDAMQNNISITMSGISLGQQILEKRKQAISESRAQHWYWGLRALNRIQQNNIQGDYYVHSFAGDDNSFSVILVNLKNGYWQEIRTSPYCADYFDETMNFHLPMLSPDGKKLFVRGIGLDSTKWEPAKAKNKLLLKGGSEVGIYNNAYILPAPSLLSYNIKDEDFVDSTKYTFSHFYGYANKSGKILIQPKYEWAGPFTDGIAQVQVNGKYGIIDLTGKFLAKPDYDKINEFDGEIACVKKDEKYGYINKSGKIVIPVQLEDGGYFTKGTAVVKINGKYGIIDQTGKYILEPTFEDLTRSIPAGEQTLYKINGKWGYVLANGKRIEAKYDDWHLFGKDGLAGVKLNDKWGFIDSNGNFVIQPQYEEINGFYDEGIAAVKINNKWGFIDIKGSWVVQPQYENFNSYLDGFGCIKLNKKWGYINNKGDMVIQPQFDEAAPFFSGRAKVKIGKKYGFINKKGDWVISPQFEDCWTFFGKSPYVKFRKKDKWGLIDTIGRVIIEPKFDDVNSEISEGLVAIEINSKWGYANLMSKVIIQPQYDDANQFIEGKAKVEINKNAIYIDNKGNITSPPPLKSNSTNKNRSTLISNADIFPVYLGRRYWSK